MKEAQFQDIYGDFCETDFFPQLDSLSNKSILITGSRGMVGGALAATMVEFAKRNPECNITVYLASRRWEGRKRQQYFNSTFIFISNELARAKHLDFNIIIHCASPSNFSKVSNLEELIDINQTFLEECISGLTECVTYISSGEVYGGEETNTQPSLAKLMSSGDRGLYPLTKLLTERYLTERGENEGFDVKILRLFHTFGPGLSKNDGRSFADFIYAGAGSQPIIMKTDGMQVRSFLYLADAVSAVFHFLTNGVKFEVHNIGSDIPITIREFAETIARVSLQEVIIRSDSEYVMSPFAEILPDIESARLAGWSPKTGLIDSINQTIRWIRK